jgi:hypothetical protein
MARMELRQVPRFSVRRGAGAAATRKAAGPHVAAELLRCHVLRRPLGHITVVSRWLMRHNSFGVEVLTLTSKCRLLKKFITNYLVDLAPSLRAPAAPFLPRQSSGERHFGWVFLCFLSYGTLAG